MKNARSPTPDLDTLHGGYIREIDGLIRMDNCIKIQLSLHHAGLKTTFLEKFKNFVGTMLKSKKFQLK